MTYFWVFTIFFYMQKKLWIWVPTCKWHVSSTNSLNILIHCVLGCNNTTRHFKHEKPKTTELENSEKLCRYLRMYVMAKMCQRFECLELAKFSNKTQTNLTQINIWEKLRKYMSIEEERGNDRCAVLWFTLEMGRDKVMPIIIYPSSFFKKRLHRCFQLKTNKISKRD